MKENITYPLNAIQWECYEEFMQAPELTQHNVTLCMPFERSSAQRFQRAADHKGADAYIQAYAGRISAGGRNLYAV